MDVEVLAIAAVAMIVLAIAVYVGARLAERKNPPIGKIVRGQGADLHYVERGSGQAIVLLHGNVTMLQDFLASRVVDALSQRFRVIIFDRPGFGYSERPRGHDWTAEEQAAAIASAMEQLGIVRPVVLGHSWGTLVALALVQAFPARVGSLVLLSGYYFPKPRVDVALAALGAMPLLGDVLRYTLTPVFTLLTLPMTLRAMFGPPPIPQRFKNEFPFSLLLRPWHLRACFQDGAIMNRQASRLQSGYAAITVPTYIAAGTEDRVVSPEQSTQLSAVIRHARPEQIPSTGHMIHHAASERVIEIISSAAGSIDRPREGHDVR